jgi:hypothetical protein
VDVGFGPWWADSLQDAVSMSRLVVEPAFYVHFRADSTYKAPRFGRDPPENSAYNDGSGLRLDLFHRCSRA